MCVQNSILSDICKKRAVGHGVYESLMEMVRDTDKIGMMQNSRIDMS